MSEVFEGGWNQIFLYEDEFLFMGLSPFYLLFPLMLLSKNRIVKMALKGVLLILASFYFAYGVVATGMPVQDFVPRMGVYLLIPLIPELIYLYYLDSLGKRK
ncbi:hypothetical protein [Crocinitomix algicola]|uniref:hypothetical protein n=1 Tax=Crocinitomix algicola TaxID=1740263 RepID=UPI0008373342|nr:hypothetical protein [Crocinitomix algicola]